MQTPRFASGLTICAWLAGLVAGSSALALQDPAQRAAVTTLENGLTVITLEDPMTPVVSLQIWVRAGSKDETRYTGIAHLFEHMMFKGSKNVPPEEHARRIETRGGRVNAFTTRDVTVYFEDVTAETLPLAIDLEAERIANLDVSEGTLASERQVVLEERRLRSEDSPEGRAFDALFATAFQAHPYRWPVIGWRSDVEAVTVEACREFFSTYYAPNNLVIVVVGAFDTAETLARIESSFGRLPPAPSIPRSATREPEQQGERTTVVRYDVKSPIIGAAWHAPAAGHADAEALDVAGEILSAGRSSRLYRRLVYDEELALSAAGGYYEMQQAGLFYAYAGVRPGASVQRAERALMDEIARLRSGAVPAADLARAKRSLEVALVEGDGTAHAIGSRIGNDHVFLGRIRPLEERLQAIERVTADDVRRVASTYLLDERRSVVRVLPPAGGSAKAAAGARAAGGSAR
jgi:zinc protease